MGAREDALLRFRDVGQRDPSVVAAFVGGSIAAHTDDEVSDVAFGRRRAHCASLLALADAENLSLEVAAMNDRVAATLFSMRSALAQMTGLKSASRSPTAGV
jgi:hypothetical protein